MRLAREIAFAIATTLASALLCVRAGAQPAAHPPGGSPERLTGTVRSVDLGARTFDLMTGVGHALRIRRIHIPAGVSLQFRGVESARAALTPGRIVRVECRSTPAGVTASSVEVLPPPTLAGKP